MALLFTIYSQVKTELDDRFLYLYGVTIVFSLILTIFTYKTEKRKNRIDFTENFSTTIKITAFSYLLHIPLNIIASLRIINDAFFNSIPKRVSALVVDFITHSFLIVVIAIIATILSFAILWLGEKSNLRS